MVPSKKKMRVVLVLEDAYERVLWLRSRVKAKARVVWARGVRSFQKLYLLLRERVDIIILDHDLDLTLALPSSERIWVPTTLYRTDSYSTERTGLEAARWLAQMPGRECQAAITIIIWSLNPSGADAMFDVLRGCAPRVFKCPITQTQRLERLLTSLIYLGKKK